MISQIQSFQLITVSNLFQKAPPVHQTITEQEILLKLIKLKDLKVAKEDQRLIDLMIDRLDGQ